MNPVETIALLPSALLGPAVWEPVQQVLSGTGQEVIVAGRPGAPRESVADVQQWYQDSLPVDRRYLLVPHSNAGLYVPALVEQRSVAGIVFVDAILPKIGTSPVAPAGLLSMLDTMADDTGRLPQWTSWWDEDAVAALFPSAAVRERVESEQSRLPLAYFKETVTVSTGWLRVPAAYLAFGDTYADERKDAEEGHWPTRVLDGNHLHMLTAPEQVAENITQLRARLESLSR